MQDTADQGTVERTETHATFTIERTFAAPVDAVWLAFSDEEARDRWFGAGDVFDVTERAHDFRVGGITVQDGQWHGGPTSRFVATYTDIVEPRRIVYTYDMWVDGGHLSTSLTTVRLDPEAGGTRLTYTEQGVHFDGLDDAGGREVGTRGIFDQLAAYVES